MSDDEYYECLRWANKTLMENYFDKQKESTIAQIDYLYDELDVTFRGFRHNTGAGQVGEASKAFTDKSNKNGNGANKQPSINRGNQSMEGVTNWENSSSDGDRFSQQESVNGNGRKNLKSFDEYMVKKQKRAKEKLEKAKKKQVIKNEEINTSAYTNWHQ